MAVRSVADPYLTRLTSDMPAVFLTEDLVLGADGGGPIPNVVNVTRELHRTPCPTECNDPYGTGSAGGWRTSPVLAVCVAAMALTLRRRRR